MVSHFNFQQHRKVKLALVCACVLVFTGQKQSENREGFGKKYSGPKCVKILTLSFFEA